MAETTVATAKTEAELDPCAGNNFKPVKAWLCVAGACFFLLLGSGSLNMLTPILKLILEEFAQDTNFGSSLNSIVSLTSLIVSLPVGWALNKWGFRKVGLFGYLVLLLAGVLGATIANSEATLMFVRILQGLGYVFPPIICIYCVTQWFPKEKQSLPIAIVASSTFLSKVVMLQMSKIAIPWMGWRGQFALYAILCIVGLILFIFFMKPGPGYAVAEAERLAKSNKEKAPLAVVLKNPFIWLIIIAQVTFSIAQRGFTTFQNMILVDNCGVTNNMASDLGTVLNLMPVLGGIFVGWLLSSKLKNRSLIVAGIFVVYFVGYITPFFMNALWQAVVFVVLVGFCSGIPQFCQVCLPKFSGSPAILAMALTVFNLVGKYASGFVAPYFVSIPQTLTGTWFWCWVPMAIVGAIGIVAIFILAINLDKRDKAEAAEKAAA